MEYSFGPQSKGASVYIGQVKVQVDSQGDVHTVISPR